MKTLFGVVVWMMMVALTFPSCSSEESKKEDCNLIADQHWSREHYGNWLIETFGIASDTMEFLSRDGERMHLLHHLPLTNTPGYYEMIGEYDQFRYGWVDTDYLKGDSVSTYLNQYLECRSRL